MSGGVIGMSKKVSKTNAARILDTLKISYELKEYEVDLENLGAVSVANKTGQDISSIYKTIVCQSDDFEYLVALVSGDKTLNLKLLAKEAGVKRVELINLKNLEKITGYIRGGCSPIGMKKAFPTFIDSDILNLNSVLVSAGLRGKQLMICVKDLILATNAKVCKIS